MWTALAPGDPWREVELPAPHGALRVRLAEAPGARAAVLLAGDAVGGFDSPAQGLYPWLLQTLPALGLSAMQLCYSDPRDLAACVADASVALDALELRGARRVGLVGHGAGAAVMVHAAVRRRSVLTVVGLAPQSQGTAAVAQLGGRSLLLLHGLEDELLPPACAQSLWARARGVRDLEYYSGAGHRLDEAATLVRDRVQGWLVRALRTGQEH